MDRAWVVWNPRLGDSPDCCGVYMASSRGKAKYRGYLNALDAGFRVKLIHFRARRAPEWDDVDLTNGNSVEYLRTRERARALAHTAEEWRARCLRLERALQPLAALAGLNIGKDRVCDWFGPSDFVEAQAAINAPVANKAAG